MTVVVVVGPERREVRAAAGTELDAATLYALLRLRVEVFVVEQRCPYPELDGRDLDAGTLHLWMPGESGVAAYARVLAEPDGSARIGRVCTAPDRRGAGLAATVVRAALERVADRPVRLSAQAHLERWYAGLGFVRNGEPFVEDGIPHVPMRHVR